MAPCPSCGGSGRNDNALLYALIAGIYALWVLAVVVVYVFA